MKRSRFCCTPLRVLFFFALLVCAASAKNAKKGAVLPQKLPFTLERQAKGTPLTEKEVTDFTKTFTHFLKKSDLFAWVLHTSHGVDASTGLSPYAVWWHDIEAEKRGDLVIFRHNRRGGGHNVMIPTSKWLSGLSAAYLLTGDKIAGQVVERFSQGTTATMKGMLWDDQDKERYIMARNIIPNNHEFVIERGRKKRVEYTLWRNETVDWNAHRIHFPHNPYWGDIYVTNMRSKDDLPHIFRAAAFLSYVVAYGRDKKVREAAQETLDYLKGFARDIVDHGYHIRTKDKEGKPYIPKQDLASFVDYESLAPLAECNAKLTVALLGYGKPRGNLCQNGSGGMYEKLAVRSHYFNYAIIRGFHMSAILQAMLHHQDALARQLLDGLAARVDKVMGKKGHKKGRRSPDWNADTAVFLLQAASVGLPLTSKEARLIQQEFSRAISAYDSFPRWDLWGSSVPDGVYGPNGGYEPNHNHLVHPEELMFLFEYCNSPFRNRSGQSPIDCTKLKR